MRQKTTAVLSAAALVLGMAGTAQAGTLEDVRDRGVLRCVVSTGIAGFAQPDANGVWGGFDIDFCRATAAAVLGDASKIEAVTSTGKTRFTKLNAGEGDVLWRNTTITFSRDVSVKLRFHGVNYYDGQGFMVKKDLGVSSASELDGASVCIQTGTTTELNLADYFSSNNMNYEPVPIETNDEARPTLGNDRNTARHIETTLNPAAIPPATKFFTRNTARSARLIADHRVYMGRVHRRPRRFDRR